MVKKEFKAESKRLLDLVINSIYTNKEIFLRELISNSSDAIDKIHYRALTDDSVEFNRNDYFIKIIPNEENRTLTISDTGIGMTKEELEENLGTIAKSGSFDFKENNEKKDGIDVIGQFGVGFYSAFMVADNIKVISKSIDSNKAYIWESSGEDGWSIEEGEKDSVGTDIILTLKEDSDEDNYTQYLEEFRLQSIIKKYSDYIRYPIKMNLTKSKLKEGSEDEYEEYKEITTVNSMTPIWRKRRNELEDEDYNNFYHDRGFGFDEPLKHIHMNIDGLLRFDSILYIPSEPPHNFWTTEYKKGLELYSSGVLIMDNCSELLPDHFGFVKGVVDSEDLSLNISREMLQQDRQLLLISRNIEKKIADELKTMLENDRENYEKFFNSFGRELKYGMYNEFGKYKESLEDLVLFYSSKDKELVSFKEYVDRMKEDQKYIYYVASDSLDKADKLPTTEFLKDKGYEILYLIEDIDEFSLKMSREYKDFEFKSINDDDLGIDMEEENEEIEEKLEENKSLFENIGEILSSKVKEVRPTNKLKNHPVRLVNDGDISIEMEKTLQQLPGNEDLEIEKILEINMNHPVFNKLQNMEESNDENLSLYVNLLYDQSRLIEGLEIEDPVAFSNNICKLM